MLNQPLTARIWCYWLQEHSQVSRPSTEKLTLKGLTARHANLIELQLTCGHFNMRASRLQTLLTCMLMCDCATAQRQKAQRCAHWRPHVDLQTQRCRYHCPWPLSQVQRLSACTDRLLALEECGICNYPY